MAQAAAAPGPSAPFSRRPYRDFLTPCLHRRFTTASVLTLLVCYVEAVWMGQWDFFWQWFPLGRAGVRTLLLFISILSVYILRIAQLHVGKRTTASPFITFARYLFTPSIEVVQTILFYSFSAWCFGEVYIWSASEDAKLSVVDDSRLHERARLNERPIYLRTMFLCIGIVQAIHHLSMDYDRIEFSSLKPGNLQSTSMEHVMSQMKQKIPSIMASLPVRIGATTVGSSIVYVTLLRHTAWRWTFMFAKTLHSLPRASRPMTNPTNVADLLGRFIVEGTLLLFLWDFANLSFDIFVHQPPMKKLSPLTDGSNDPNFSLLAGLKAKKEVTRNFAFWELSIIAQHFPDRRKTIFEDINRASGSTWSQIVTVCLGELHAVVKRIQDYETSSTPQPSQQNGQQRNVQTLPRLTAPLKDGQIYKAAPPPPTRLAAIENGVGTFAKTVGQSPGSPDPVTGRARKLLTYGTDALLSKTGQQQQQGQGKFPTSLTDRFNAYLVAFLRSPLGYPFRQTFSRRAAAVVTGTPFSSLGPITDAITSLTRLAVSSLKEDPFGRVQLDVPNIIRTMTSTCEVVESFAARMPAHWTDVGFVEGMEGRRVGEVEGVLGALRAGLRDLVNEFGEYRDYLGLSAGEVRAAKEAVARGRAGAEE